MKKQPSNISRSKSFSSKIWKTFFTTGIILMLSTMVHAQGSVEEDPDAPQVPIDGGISLLIAAGVGLGAKKVYEARKRKEDAGM